METCKFKVGQLWRTRRGDDVEIVRVNDLNGQYPVIGRMNKENWQRSWTKDGKFAAGAEEIPRGGDLVELLQDAPGSRDRAGPPTPRSEPVGLKESIGRLEAKGTGFFTVKITPETYEALKSLFEFKADTTPIKWPKIPDAGEVWKTRGGKEAFVTGVLAGYPREICGRIEGWMIELWKENGRVLRDEEHQNDLVEFVRKIEPVIAKGKAAVLDYVAYPEAVGIVKDINPERYVQVSINPPAAQESIADEAKRIVAGVRRKQYGGTPERSFTAIADFWTALFKAKGRPEMVFTAEDVSPMMRLLKEARLCSSPDHRDSMVDIIGYTLTDAELRGIETPPAPEV